MGGRKARVVFWKSTGGPMNRSETAKPLRDALDDAVARLARVGVILDKTTPETADGAFSELDLTLRDAQALLDACRRFATLVRPSSHAPYRPVHLLRRLSAQLSAPSCAQEAAADVELPRGDEAQVAECLKLLVDNARLPQGGSLHHSAFLDNDEPHITMSLAGGGRFDEPLLLGPFAFDAEAFQACWRAATAGGAVERDDGGVRLWLTGDADVPGGLKQAAAAAGPAGRAAQALMPWRGAIGVYDEGYASVEESLRLYRQASETARRYAGMAKESL
jgi:hypothetical protein